MEEIKALAKRIARELLADLKAGKLEAIGIDQIRAACERSQDEAQAALEKARRIKNWGTQPLLKKQKPGRVNASEPDAAAGPDEARSWAR